MWKVKLVFSPLEGKVDSQLKHFNLSFGELLRGIRRVGVLLQVRLNAVVE